MLIATFPAGAFATNCYVVAPAAGEECVIIDPGQDAEAMVYDVLREHRLKPVAVALTHGHIDHVWSVVPVCGARDVPAYIHPDDRALLSDPAKGFPPEVGRQLLGGLTFGEPDDVRELGDGETLTLAGLDFVVDHAPGHTPGSVTFRLAAEPVMFSGDLLFAGSIGRTDMPGGDYATIMESLARVCLPLPDETAVLPGHGAKTTIGQERTANPFLKESAPLDGPHGDFDQLMSFDFRAPKGVNEYVPPRSATYLAARDAFAATATRAGYAYLELPVFEDTRLFSRGVGESTDVVSKEMYTFEDRGGRSITLRPEFTVGVLRSVLQHGLHKGELPVKVWATGPAFRYERAQAGRYRQFYQVDLEAIGSEDPAVDVETIALAWDWYRELGLTRLTLNLNSLGCRECRPVYRAALQEFLRGLDLDDDTRARVEINPLRVLDDKRPDVRAQVENAPLVTDYLCGTCKAHHDKVRELLADLSIPWTDEPRLVRGLDYYTRTTFEFDHPLLGAQSGIGGGGRYDGLSEDIGGPSLPGIGFGLGLDRTVLAMEAEEVAATAGTTVAVYGVPLGEEAQRRIFGLVTELRRAGIAADMSYDGKKIKGAMRGADRSGAAYALILGERDLAEGAAQVKDLVTGEQEAVPLDRVADVLKEKLG